MKYITFCLYKRIFYIFNFIYRFPFLMFILYTKSRNSTVKKCEIFDKYVMQEPMLNYMADKRTTFTNKVTDHIACCYDENGDDNDSKRMKYNLT